MRAMAMVVLGCSGPAWAAPALDYAAPEDCPDAGRFADEVSARIGVQAFGGDEPRMVVRIALAGAERIGTLELGTGTRLVRSATCPEVFDGLVVAAATLLDARPAPPVAVVPAPEAPPPAASDKVTVKVDSTKPGVTVARITGRGTATNGQTTAVATYYEDLCVAPCSFELPRGFHEIGTYGKGTRGVTAKFDLRDPEVHLESRPVSAAGMYAAYLLMLGGGLAGTFGVIGLVDPCESTNYTNSGTQTVTDTECTARRPLATLGAVGGVVAIGGSFALVAHNGKIQIVP